MANAGYSRKLAAIFSADVADYSRLMGEDEAGTVQAIRTHFQAISEEIAEHRGRVVDISGDNLLAEFASVVDAVQCAVEVQEEIRLGNAELPETRRVVFRIGINLGDVIEEEGRIYGEGVNIAARIEQLAEPGGVYISGTAYDQVKNKIAVGYEYRGEQRVKNIQDPVRVYRIVPVTGGTTVQKSGRDPARRPRKRILAAVAGAMVALSAVALWHFSGNTREKSAAPAPESSPVPPLPSEVSVAVLHFENMTGDPDQEYLGDGLTEDITTSLSQLPRLFVIARSSTKKYKGKDTDVRTISRELGVRYLLEGSIQRAGTRIRINCQLIDSTTGDHVWAERFERDEKEFLEARDGIILEVASSLAGELTDGDFAKIIRRRVNSLEAWEAIQRGYAHYERWAVEDQVRARKWYRKAIELEPNSVLGWMGVAWTFMKEGILSWGPESKEMFRKAIEVAEKVRGMDPSFYGPYMLLANIQVRERNFEEAVANARKCYELEPNYINTIYIMAHVLTYVGKQEAEEAIGLLKKVMRLNPNFRPQYPHSLGRAYHVTGQTAKAIEWYKVAVEKNPKWAQPHVDLAAIYAGQGREDEMRAEAAEILRLKPDFSVKGYLATVSLPKDRKFGENQREMLLKAGLPR